MKFYEMIKIVLLITKIITYKTRHTVATVTLINLVY